MGMMGGHEKQPSAEDFSFFFPPLARAPDRRAKRRLSLRQMRQRTRVREGLIYTARKYP